jgi:hypothetical protein
MAPLFNGSVNILGHPLWKWTPTLEVDTRFGSGHPLLTVLFFHFHKKVAVGMRIAPHPPHRSVRALLTHTAPTSDIWRQVNLTRTNQLL